MSVSANETEWSVRKEPQPERQGVEKTSGMEVYPQGGAGKAP